MSKIRVYEYAKKQNTSSKDIIEKLKGLNVTVSNHMSMIDRDTANKLDNIFNGKQASQPNNSGKNTANNNQHTRNKSNTATNIQNKTQSNNSVNAVKRSNDKTDKKSKSTQ